jgi:hypothetical protein
MDEKNISMVPNEVASEVFKAASENFYNNGYINGCIEGIKVGKRTGEANGFLKGAAFVLITAGVGFGLYLMGKAVVDEVDDMFGCNDKKPEEGEWKEVKEDNADGSESV